MTVTSTVYVVDDDPAVRHSLTRLLDSAGFSSACYQSAEAFLEAYTPEQPGCLLLDVRMPGMSGLELQAELKARTISLPVLIVTGHADVPMAINALKAGAFDFIEKPYDDQALLEQVDKAIALDIEQRRQATRYRACQARLATLSPREREIMDGLTAGQTVEQIAAELGISPKTVYMHRSHLMDKLGSDSIAELVQLKYEASGAPLPGA